MSQQVKCWFAEDPDEADYIEAYCAMDAAEKYIERRWPHTDYATAHDVFTRDSFGVIRRFEVTVATEPVFSAREVAP